MADGTGEFQEGNANQGRSDQLLHELPLSPKLHRPQNLIKSSSVKQIESRSYNSSNIAEKAHAGQRQKFLHVGSTGVRTLQQSQSSYFTGNATQMK